MMFTIVKINKDTKECEYLYKNRKGIYLFSKDITNVKFNTEDEATNFIFHNSSHINTQDNDSLFVIPIRGDDND